MCCVVGMAASKHAMPAFSAYRVEVVVLGMALFAEPSTFVGAPGTSFTVSSTRTLGSLSLSVCNSNHRKTLLEKLDIRKENRTGLFNDERISYR